MPAPYGLGAFLRYFVGRAGLLALVVAVNLPGAVLAQGAASEDAVKAAYLYKLRHYVEWPGKRVVANEAAIVIGLVGAGEIAENLLQMPGVSDRPGSRVQMRLLRPNDALDGVNLLFVADAYWSRTEAMVAAAGRQGILVVSETEGALKAGSIINFRYADERVRFEIALDTAERTGLKLNAQLLSLALAVHREKRK